MDPEMRKGSVYPPPSDPLGCFHLCPCNSELGWLEDPGVICTRRQRKGPIKRQIKNTYFMPAAQHKLCLLILTAPGSGQEPRRHVDTQLSLFLSLALMSPPCQAMPCPSPFPTAPPARRPQVGPWVTAGHPRVSLPPLCTSNPVSHGIPLFWGQDPRSIGPSHPTGSPPSSAHTAPSCARPEASRSPLVAPSAPGPRACVLAVPHVWNAFPSPLHLVAPAHPP